MSRIFLHIVGLIFIFNLVLSTWNLLDDGLVWRRAIPVVCWLIATILWYTLKLFKLTARSSSES